jgi:hypothetical protein
MKQAIERGENSSLYPRLYPLVALDTPGSEHHHG